MKWFQSSKISLVFIIVLGFAVVAPATEDTWTYKADIPTTRTWVGGCVLNGKIYVIGGARSDSSATSTVEVYDPLLDTWTKMANIPSVRCYHATCTFDGKIYVFGGGPGVWSPADRSVFLYDPQTGTWTQRADMPYAIGAGGIAVVENTIYLIGGAIDTSSPPVSTFMAYDPTTESWTQKADMPTARLCLSACVVDGKIYAIGGCKEDWETFAYKLVEVYDPSTNTWARKRDMPTARWSPAACVADGKIYATGGNLLMQALTVNEVYDPATDTWTTKAPMQQKRLGHFLGLVGNKIYAIGGHYPWLIMVPKTEEYDTGLTAVPSPDFNGDWIVDFKDFSKLAQYWGQDESSVDIAPSPFGDNIVNYKDLAVFAENWLIDFSLVAHWKLDETEGTIAHDSISNKHGNLNGNPIWQPESGKIDGALQLDGIDDYISTPFILNPAGGPFTVFAWVKGGNPGQVVISQQSSFLVPRGKDWLCADPLQGRLMTFLTDGSPSTSPLISEFVITDGDWHYIAVIWDGSRRLLYADGIKVAEDSSTLANLVSSDKGLYLGAGRTLGAGTFWSGLIDDVCIYDRAITP
jgi:N-acetylneuraminic acid mutarotase